MRDETSEHRQHAPATLRNRDSFSMSFAMSTDDGRHPRDRERLGRARRSLCEECPSLVFQPSDPDPDARLRWVKATGVTNVGAPLPWTPCIRFGQSHQPTGLSAST
jgi:hypothetical protein